MTPENARKVAVRIRRSFLFTAITLLIYALSVAPFTELGSALNSPFGSSSIVGGVWVFVASIVLFVLAELVYMKLCLQSSHDKR